MGHKIPVGATIAKSYRFAFANYLDNLGAVWLPVTILLAGSYVLTPHYMAALSGMQGIRNAAAQNAQDPAALKQAMQASMGVLAAAAPYFLALFLTIFVCFASISAGITKEALGLRTGSAYLQFPFGKAFLRLIGAYLFLLAAFAGLYIGMAIAMVVFGAIIGMVAAVFGGLAGAGGEVVLAAGIALLVVASLAAFLYAAVRLGFLLAPVVMAEERISLLRGWALTRGNFWRIIAVALAIWLPLIAAELAYLYWLMGPGFFPPYHPGMTPQELAAWSQHLNAFNLQMMETMQSHWYITYPLGLLVGVPIYGLINGVAAFAYRSLVPVDGTEAA